MTTDSHAPDATSLRLTANDVKRLAAVELAVPSRVGHTLLLMASLAATGAIGSLWVTEPELPVRTHVAFAAMVSIGLAWSAFAAWVLARRRVLFGAERVIAARMGVAFSVLSGVVFLAAASFGGAGRFGYVAAATNGAMAVAAFALLAEARRRVAALTERRELLERVLAGAPRSAAR